MTRSFLKFLSVYVMSVVAVSVAMAEEVNVASTFGSKNTNIGIAALTVNTVTGTIEDQTVPVNGSDAIFQNEIIETKANSTTQFMFLDETVLTVGPESRLVLDEMFFDPDATEGKLVMSAMKGLFTFVSGSLPSESYEVKTPTVSIAVRGTKFNLFVARNGASTVVLKSGAVDVKNLRGVTRRISKPGLATRVSTKQSPPTKPDVPSVELTELFKPLANPGELKGKSPDKINYEREYVEEKNVEIQQVILKKEAEDAAKNRKVPKKVAVKKESPKKTKAELAREKKEANLEKKAKKAELAREKKEANLEKKAKKAELAKEKKDAKLEKKAKKAELAREKKTAKLEKKAKKAELAREKKTAKLEKKAKKAGPVKKTARLKQKDSPKLTNKVVKKGSKKKKKLILPKKAKAGVKKAAKVAKGSSKKAAKTAKVASKTAKGASKKAAKTAKAASKTAKKASKKAATTAKAASKTAKKASKKAAKTAKAASKAAKKASKKAAKTAKAASKAAKKASKKAAIKAKAAAKAAKKASKRAAKRARAQAKQAVKRAKVARQVAKKFAFERRLPLPKKLVE